MGPGGFVGRAIAGAIAGFVQLPEFAIIVDRNSVLSLGFYTLCDQKKLANIVLPIVGDYTSAGGVDWPDRQPNGYSATLGA